MFISNYIINDKNSENGRGLEVTLKCRKQWGMVSLVVARDVSRITNKGFHLATPRSHPLYYGNTSNACLKET